MAYVTRVLSSRLGNEGKLNLAGKVGAALLLCLVVQVLLAQAPATGPLVREEVDQRGFKYLVPQAGYLDPKNKSKLNDQKNFVRKLVTSQPSDIGSNPGTKTTLDSYYMGYQFPIMTTEEGLKNLADERARFLRDHVAAAKDPAMHTYLIGITFSTMSRIVQDPAYLPAARYNAMYIISNLNDQEPSNIGSVQTLPEPMRSALPLILQQFQKGTSDEIKIAALLGLSRHLEWENYKQPPSTPMQPANRTAVIKELTTLAEAKESPAGREADVHTWMRRRAIEGLCLACLAKPDADIAATMERLLKDEANPMSVRMSVATAFGRMSLQAPAKIDAVPTAKELGYLALAACEAELTNAENLRKNEYEHQTRLSGTFTGGGEYSSLGGGGAGAMSMPGSPGRMPGMPGMSGEGGVGGSLRGPLRPSGGVGGVGGEGGAYGGAMPGGYGGGYGGEGATGLDPSLQDPKFYQMEYLRRRIRQQLYAVQMGLLGSEDHQEKKAVGAPATPPPTPTTVGERKEPRGMFAIAKAGGEKDQVDQVYFKVRKLAEVVEAAGVPSEPGAQFYQFVKDMRKEMKPLEQVVGRRVAAAAAPVNPGLDDAPAGGPAGKAGPGKGAPGQKGAVPAAPGRPAVGPGKNASRPPMRPQPNVFGQPRIGR